MTLHVVLCLFLLRHSSQAGMVGLRSNLFLPPGVWSKVRGEGDNRGKGYKGVRGIRYKGQGCKERREERGKGYEGPGI